MNTKLEAKKLAFEGARLIIMTGEISALYHLIKKYKGCIGEEVFDSAVEIRLWKFANGDIKNIIVNVIEPNFKGLGLHLCEVAGGHHLLFKGVK